MSPSRARRRVCASALLLAFSAAAGCAHGPRRRAGGWITLLDASKLGEWRRAGDANWRVVDGLIQADAGNGYLVSSDSYADLEVRAELWVDDDANSGVFLRCQDPANITPFNSYEVNVFDRTPNPGFGTGSIVTLAKVPPTFKAGGRWNTLEIEAKGPRITVDFNGTRTVELIDEKHRRGPIAVQRAAGIVKLRRIEARPL